MDNKTASPIAIVGISVEIPGGSSTPTNLDHENFFRFLLDKGESYTRVPSDRFNIDSWHGPNPGQICTEKGSFLKDVTLFDNFEFGVSPKDAKYMSLSARKLIEHSFLALWDAGIPYRHRNVGAYMSGTAFDLLSVADHNEYDSIGSLNGAPAMIANCVSYHLDLCGPSIPVDTACSSSATALHLAVQAIRAGDCEAAIVGGCQINHRFIDFIEYSQGSILAPDGKCKPFDMFADGFSRGEAVAAVVLKPLDEAVKDGDYIYATILGTAANSTGSAAPLHAPVPASQEIAMLHAYSQTNRSPTEVDYVELHATGTAVGDPLEANWVGKAFQRDDELSIGSVKGNIGHTEITSFLSSLSKVCSMFQTKVIPPNVNLNKLNPKIKWDEYRLRVATEPTPIEPRNPSGRFLISMNSSGIGGSNAHVIVESFLNPPYTTSEPNLPVLVVAGGLSSRSAAAVADNLAELLPVSEDPSQISVAYGRRALQTTWRSFAVFRPDTPLTFSQPRFISRKRPPLVFVMGGQGPQHINMGRQLFQQNPVFRASILELDSHYRHVTGHSIIERYGLFGHATNAEVLPMIWPIRITLPAIAMVQIAMLDLLRSIGVVPNVVVGHSAGETAMLYACGAVPKELALEIAIGRGVALTALEEDGGSMAAFPCSPDIANSIIDKVKREGCESVELACYNSADAVTLSGLEEELGKAIEIAREMGIKAQKLRTRFGVHSAMMEGCHTSHIEHVATAFEHFPGNHSPDPSVVTFSTVYAREWRESFNSEYIWTNTRSPVLFTQAVDKIKQTWPDANYLEISPHPVLSQYVAGSDVSADLVLCPMKRSKVDLPWNEYTWFLEAVGGLAVLGYKVDFLQLNHATRFAHSAPSFPYPFAKKSVPYQPETSPFIRRQFEQRNGPLNFSGLRVSTSVYPDLAEHVINSQPIMPAAGFLEMAFEFGATLLWNVKFTSMLPLLNEKTIAIEVTQNDAYWSVRSSPPGSSEAATRLHAEGYLSREPVMDTFEPLDIEAIKTECTLMDTEALYQSISHFAHYGPLFKRTVKVFMAKNHDSALAEVRAIGSDLTVFHRPYVISPVVLDACFHVMMHPYFTNTKDPNVYYLPAAVGSLVIHSPLPQTTATAYARPILKSWTPERVVYDLVIADASGARICSFFGFAADRHEKVHVSDSAGRLSYDLVYQPISIPPLRPKTSSELNGNVVLDLDDHQHKSYPSSSRNSPEPLLNHPGRAIGQTLDHIISEGRKRAIRILDFGKGTSQLLDDERLNEIFTTRRNQGAVFHYTRCGIISRQDLTKLTSIVLDNRRAIASNSLPWGPSTFDLILTSNASSPVEEVSSYLASLQTLLVPGGCLVVSTEGWQHDDPLEAVDKSTWLEGFKAAEGFSASFSTTTEQSAFTIVAQKRPVIDVQLARPFQKDVAVYEFSLDVPALQSIIGQTKSQLWITADSDCGAAVGFVRGIRRETIDLEVRLVSFDQAWSKEQRFAFVQQLSRIAGLEPEIQINAAGEILVPRCVPVYGRSEIASGSIVEKPAPHASDDILVKVIQSYPTSIGLCGVIGRVVHAAGAPDVKESDLVFAVIEQAPSSDVLSVQSGTLVALSTANDVLSFAPFATPLFLVGMSAGFGHVRNPFGLKSKRIAITVEDPFLADVFTRFFTHFGAQVETLVIKPSPTVLSVLQRSDMVVSCSSSPSNIHILRSTINGNATLQMLADPLTGVLAQIRRDPWIVKEMLTELRTLYQSVLEPLLYNLPIPESIPGSVSHTKATLFRSDRAYLLIGGIGSLGLEIALWMYENGAREIVLTSRSGRDTLLRPDNIRARRICHYMETLPDLKLTLAACDGSSRQEMAALLELITIPIAGCMLLTVVLNDRLFLSHSQDTFEGSLAAKKGVFETVQALVPIQSLDFLVALSSFASLGNAGQASYGSGNTAVDWMLRKYPNAFSLLGPGIVDSRMFVDDDGRYEFWADWGLTCREICYCIADGLDKMKRGPFWLYIPDIVKWYRVKENLGSVQLYQHLISRDDAASDVQTSDRRAEIQEVTRKLLDIKPEDLSDETPLTSYGLDSLVAGKLAFSLRPFVTISQLELLADLTLNEIYTRMNQEHAALSKQTKSSFTWDALNQSGQTIVKLVEGEGVPLILLHGGDSTILPFAPLQDRFSSALWAIQVTPETPISTVQEIAKFYYDQIKQQLPEGPYRLAGFSGSTLIVYELAFLFESNGDQVAQLVNLDLPPTIYSSGMFDWDSETVETGHPSSKLLRQIIGLITSLSDADPGNGSVHRTSRELANALEGSPVPEAIGQAYQYTKDGMVLQVVQLLLDLARKAGKDLLSETNAHDILLPWTNRVKTPLQLVLPVNGVSRVVAEQRGLTLEDLRVRDLNENVEVVILEGYGHFTMFESDQLAELLQKGWKY